MRARFIMSFDRQQELLRLEMVIRKPLAMNEALMLRELCKKSCLSRSIWPNAEWLAIGAGISTKAAQLALRKLRARKLVHYYPSNGYRLRVKS